MQQAEVLRIIYGPDGAIKPGAIIDVTDWPSENLRALEQDGRIRVGGPETELTGIIQAQQERIAELTAKLVDADLSFDPEIHVSEDSKKADGTYRRKAGRKSGDK